ncbi:MAG: phage integrase N-terminal SAM-like domain-containing protein, partial [Cyanobacteriota bacterium]|nr:phage integrase N-terminal SAM-like domain-containing protein [Cyanobacteriota bacterium]
MDTYVQWLRRFLRFHSMRHTREMGSAEVNAFLTHLAVEGQVSASTQNQALSAVLFLYRVLLERDLDLEGVVRARKPQRLPVVLTEEEVRSVLQRLEGTEALVAGLLYGSGLRLMEALRLRVHDLDFNRQELTVRNGKGGKDRRTMLPKRLSKKLQIHLEKVLTVHKRDLIDGWGAVQLPYALARKYRNAATEWGWQSGLIQSISRLGDRADVAPSPAAAQCRSSRSACQRGLIHTPPTATGSMPLFAGCPSRLRHFLCSDGHPHA